jgi:hypothetical protein
MIGTSVLFLVNTIIQRGLGRWTTNAQYSSKSCYEFLFQGQSYQDLGDLTGAHGPPRGSSSTSGWLAKIDAGPERDWRGGGSHTHHAARL